MANPIAPSFPVKVAHKPSLAALGLGLFIGFGGLAQAVAMESAQSLPASEGKADDLPLAPRPPDKDDFIEAPDTPDYWGKRPPWDAIKPYANLAGADLSNMNLSRCTLTGINLEEADLRGTRFNGAELDGANLFKAKLAGATLTGASLVMANVYETSGLELHDAKLHSFFARQPDDVPGTCKLYTLPDAGYRPQKILVGSRGDVFLLQKGKATLWTITPTGVATTMTSTHGPIQTIARDSRNRLWCFQHNRNSFIDDSCLYLRRFSSSHHVVTTTSGITSATGTGHGTMWVSMPGSSLEYFPDAAKGDTTHTMHSTGSHCLRSMAASPDGGFVLGIDPRTDIVFIRQLPNPRHEPHVSAFHQLRLSLGSRPQCVVWAGPDLFCYTAPGVNGIGFIQAGKGGIKLVKEYTLAGSTAQPNVGLHHVALGPDGRLWFTLKTPGAIGWITPDGNRGIFPLEDGMVPEDITPGRDGNLYFTLEGQAAIGCIRAFDPAPEVTEPAPMGSEVPKRTAKVAPEDPVERKQEAVEHQAGTVSVPVHPTRAERTPMDAPTTVLDRIRAFGVDLEEHRITHILNEHTFGLPKTGGQFFPRFCTREAIPEIVLEGLRRADAIAKVVKRYDPYNLRHTPCCFDEPIGRYQSWGAWYDTSCLDIVTREVIAHGVSHQSLKSAYPISPRRFDPEDKSR